MCVYKHLTSSFPTWEKSVGGNFGQKNTSENCMRLSSATKLHRAFFFLIFASSPSPPIFFCHLRSLNFTQRMEAVEVTSSLGVSRFFAAVVIWCYRFLVSWVEALTSKISLLLKILNYVLHGCAEPTFFSSKEFMYFLWIISSLPGLTWNCFILLIVLVSSSLTQVANIQFMMFIQLNKTHFFFFYQKKICWCINMKTEN